MKNAQIIFHRISYLQYPFYLLGAYFIVIPLLEIAGLLGNAEPELQPLLDGTNMMLLFFGLAASLATLQDPNKTQNDLSKKVWEDAKKGKNALLLLGSISVFFISAGLIALLLVPETGFGSLGYGLLALGIAYVGILRAAMEMFTNHQRKSM